MNDIEQKTTVQKSLELLQKYSQQFGKSASVLENLIQKRKESTEMLVKLKSVMETANGLSPESVSPDSIKNFLDSTIELPLVLDRFINSVGEEASLFQEMAKLMNQMPAPAPELKPEILRGYA